jgi:hypothetical protein
MAEGVANLYFDFGAYAAPSRCILSGLTSSTPQTDWGFVAGDQLQLVLWPRNIPAAIGGATTTQRLNLGSIIVTGKPTTNLAATTLFFEAINFVEANTEEDDSGDWSYTGYLNLNTTELIAAVGSEESTPFLLVIDVIDSTGKPQRWLAEITVYNPVYTGSEGSPTPATPAFWTAAQTQLNCLNNWNFITDTGGGTATSLNAQPTAGAIALGTQVALRGISTVNSGGYSIWEYSTSAPAGAATVQPLDYNASTNPGKWVQVL